MWEEPSLCLVELTLFFEVGLVMPQEIEIVPSLNHLINKGVENSLFDRRQINNWQATAFLFWIGGYTFNDRTCNQ